MTVMDENPPRPHRLLGLIAASLIDSAFGSFGGVVVYQVFDAMLAPVEMKPWRMWREVREQRIMLFFFGGMIVGALAGFGLFDVIRRSRR